jgi:gas vesicle protein
MKKFIHRRKLSTLSVGVVLGGVIGVSIGILFAPDKGSETRKKHAAFRKQVVGFIKRKFNPLTEEIVPT